MGDKQQTPVTKGQNRTELAKKEDSGSIAEKAKSLSCDLGNIMSQTHIKKKKGKEMDNCLKSQVKTPVVAAIFSILLFLGLFVVWGGLAELNSAAAAQGTIIVSNYNDKISHADGGIVRKIFVRDGDKVKPGDALLEIHDSGVYAQREILVDKVVYLTAKLNRLNAEGKQSDHIKFDDSILHSSDPDAREMMEMERKIFESRIRIIKGQRDVAKEKIIEISHSIDGMRARLKYMNNRKYIVKEELVLISKLRKQGLATKYRELDAKNKLEDIRSQIASTDSQIREMQQSVKEMELRLKQITNSRLEEVSSQIISTQSQLHQIQSQLISAEDKFQKLHIRAHSSGTIHNVQINTIGGVIPSKSLIMEIVPDEFELIIEGRITPQDIAYIEVGNSVEIQLGAYSAKLVPRIKGMVTYVAPDKTSDRSGDYYPIKVSIDEKSLDSVSADVKIIPGMPATVFVVRGSRTPLSYLIAPFASSFNKAFAD